MKIGVVVNPNKEGAMALAKEVSCWLENRQHQVFQNLSQDIVEWINDCDLLICLGGDGTLLSSATHMKMRSVPIFGINLGTVGFLTEIKREEVYKELERFLSGEAQIEDRVMLSCSVSKENEVCVKEFNALNDVVLSREGLTRMLSVSVHINGQLLTSFLGDGIILATPTGSTAYSLSAGGVIVHPQLEAILITPICPHASSLRPIIIPPYEEVVLRVSPKHGESKATVTMDGQTKVEIDDSYIVRVKKSSLPVKMIKSAERNYFQTLREKFRIL